MLALISPAKRMNSIPPVGHQSTDPYFLDQSQILLDVLRTFDSKSLASLMKVSPTIAELNWQRYQAFTFPLPVKDSGPAALLFGGDTYLGLEAATLGKDSLIFAQNHLAILSGLYGLLRPLDRMLPYRLEMGTRLTTGRGKNLYAFWGDVITKEVNARTAGQKSRAVINLASAEYIKAIQPDKLAGPFITPQFKEADKDGRLRVIGLRAKRARGQMARHMIAHRLKTPEDLKNFDHGGYGFDSSLSSESEWVFVRQPTP